ncbi:glycosyltransferase [Diplocloster hominis]|uniref:glycosyltransferase n=1 Tax=Diplocloster hominis TaxID=3079010 RepID=UPI0031BA1448
MEFDYTQEPGKVLYESAQINDDLGYPLISIITPFYNSSKYFEQTYNCVLNQTFPWFEWIIVNDGSTEDINDVIKLVDQDIRIKLINQENKGQASARNRAIKESNTDIIVPLDADDLIIPTFLEYIFWGLYFNPECSWCYTDSVGFQEDNYVWSREFSSDMMKYNNILVCTAGIRRNDILEIGCYDESRQHYDEDWKLWLELLAKGKKPVHLNVIGFWYRRTSSGMGKRLRNNDRLLKQSNELISISAKKIKEPVYATEFPLMGITNRFKSPVKHMWKRYKESSNSKTNVLMIIPWMEMGGADLFNLEVVKRINKNKFNISIMTTTYAENSWRQKFENEIQEIFELPKFLEITDYAEFISYYIVSRKIDVIFLSNSYIGYYLLPWLKIEFPKIKVIDYVHMEEWYWRNGGYARLSGAFGTLIDKTLVCNNKTENVLYDHFERKHNTVSTVYIGVDKDIFSNKGVRKGYLHEKLNIDADRPIVLFPCRIHPQKRPFLMVAIAEMLQKRYKEIAFVVVGDGPQLGEMQSLIREKNLDKIVYFNGRQNDMRPCYADAFVTLICSLKEGLALTAYESLAMGVPVITSDVGGQAELVDESVGCVLPLYQNEEDSLDERIYEKKEVEQYVNVIIEMLKDNDKYSIIKENCRKRIEEKFSCDIMINNIEHEIQKVLSVSNVQEYNYEALAAEFITLYTEYELLENYANNVNHPINEKSELLRMANSRLGSKLIKIAFKLRLNKLFR